MKPIKSPSRQSQTGKKISLKHALAVIKLNKNGSIIITDLSLHFFNRKIRSKNK